MSQRTISILLSITLITLFGLTAARLDAEEATPALVIPSPRHDAGSHWEGESVSHTFEVKNAGSGELRILNVKPG